MIWIWEALTRCAAPALRFEVIVRIKALNGIALIDKAIRFSPHDSLMHTILQSRGIAHLLAERYRAKAYGVSPLEDHVQVWTQAP
jgi:hypothetical protein